jgi:uncharacterized protein
MMFANEHPHGMSISLRAAGTSAMEHQSIPKLNSELEEVVRRLVQAYQPERIYLFGSHARNDATEDSDYDLLVVVPESAKPEQRRSRLAYEVLWGTGAAADVLVTTVTQFERRAHLNASLAGTVRREGRLVYDHAA